MKTLRLLTFLLFVVVFSQASLGANNWPYFDWTGKHADVDDWNQYVFDGLDTFGGNLMSVTPKDISQFCPKYSNLNLKNKKYFWISLIAAMSRFESNFNPQASFREGFTDSRGKYVVSRGLLQLSYESARGYGCPISKSNDLHIPKINLECTIRILDRWIGRDSHISAKWSGSWKGGARYWSVLRKRSTLSSIKAKTSSLGVCN